MTIREQDESTRLGREAAGRLRLPGPPLGKPLPSRVGSLASSVERFTSSLSRPVEIRRSLRGPGSHEESVRPPRWWTGDSPQREEAAPPQWLRRTNTLRREALPERGLPRAAHAVPNDQTYTPGGIVNGLHAEVARVRRLNDVVAAGAMLTSADRVKVSAATVARRRAEAVRASAIPESAYRAVAPQGAPPETPAAPSSNVPQPNVPETVEPAAKQAPAPEAPAPETPARRTAAKAAPSLPPETPEAPARSGGATKFAAAKAPSVAGRPAASPSPEATPTTIHRSASSSAPDSPSAPASASSDGPSAGTTASDSAPGPDGGSASMAALAAPSSLATESAPEAVAPMSPVGLRPSFQLRPVASRLAASVGRGEAVRMPAALRRSIGAGHTVRAAAPQLIDSSVPAAAAAGAARELTSATSVVRRLARGRAELERVEARLSALRAVPSPAAAPAADPTPAKAAAEPASAPADNVTPIRRTPASTSSQAEGIGRREAEAPAGQAASTTLPDAVVRRLPTATPSAAAPSSTSSASPAAASPSANALPVSLPEGTVIHRSASTSKPSAPAASVSDLSAARGVSAGHLSQVSGAWAAENLAGGSPSLAGLGIAMPDLLATQRSSSRSGDGPMPSSFSPASDIRPATAALTGSSPRTGGKLFASDDAARFVARRRVARPADGGVVPLLTPSLRRSVVRDGGAAGSADSDGPLVASSLPTQADVSLRATPVAPLRSAPGGSSEPAAPAARSGLPGRSAAADAGQASETETARAAADPSRPGTADRYGTTAGAFGAAVGRPPVVPMRRALRSSAAGLSEAPSPSPVLRRLAADVEQRAEQARSQGQQAGRESSGSDYRGAATGPAARVGSPFRASPRSDAPSSSPAAPGAPTSPSSPAAGPSSSPGVPEALRRTPFTPSRAARHEHGHEAAADLLHADYVRRIAAEPQTSPDGGPARSAGAPGRAGSVPRTAGDESTVRRFPNLGKLMPKGLKEKAASVGKAAISGGLGNALGSIQGGLVPAPPRGAGPAVPKSAETSPKQNEPIGGGSRGGDLFERTAHLFDDSPAMEVGGLVGGISPALGEALNQLQQLQQRNSTPAATDAVPTGADLERIVSAVVDRIEQRVVDELERRGQRNGRNGF